MTEQARPDGPPNYRDSVDRCQVCMYCVIQPMQTYIGHCIKHRNTEGGWTVVEPEGVCESFDRKWNARPLRRGQG